MADYPTAKSVGIFYAMKRNFTFKSKSFLLFLLSLLALVGCNKDNDITIPLKPEISFEQQRFPLKMGQSIVLQPQVENHDSQISYLWTMQGVTLSNTLSYTFVAEKVGTYILAFTATNSSGSTSENIRIDVSELAPPQIAFAVGSERVFEMVMGRKYTLSPDIVSQGQCRLEWSLDGKYMGNEKSLDLSFDQTGDHTLLLSAENSDGKSHEELTLRVLSHINDMFYIPTSRHIPLGRTLYLEPTLWDMEPEEVSFEWSLPGEVIGTESMLRYTPKELGKEKITLKVSANGHTEVREIEVECHPSEQELMRPAGQTSQASCSKVFSYTPAAGQFINETNSGFRGENTPEAAAAYAERRLKEQNYLSLGAWGGEIIVGFDHSVEESFSIGGNFYEGSSEAGIVWVMQDTNQNGLPDDEWYELRGSEWGGENHHQLHAITYFRPKTEGGNILWRDNKLQTGCVYRNGTHTQETYFPSWISADSYTLYGSWLNANTVRESTGKYVNNAYAWGYADNEGEDSTKGGDDGAKSYVEFKIENAVNADGTPANLLYIDFVRVQTAISHTAGELGEISTEITYIGE